MPGIVIYKSRYGAARQYAQWAASELGLPLLEAKKCRPADFAACQYLLIGTSVYVGKMLIRDWLYRYQSELVGKKLFLFVVCATAPAEKEKLELYIKASIPPALRGNCRYYFLRGKLEYQQLRFMDKLVLRLGAAMAKDPEVKKTMLTDYNEVKQEQLATLIRDIRELRPEN